MRQAAIHDVIQIKPNHAWEGCLAIVTKSYLWGVQCYVEIPGQGRAYNRLVNGDFEVLGPAKFVPEDEQGGSEEWAQ